MAIKKRAGILTKEDIIKEKIIIDGKPLINASNCDLTLGKVYLQLERNKCVKELKHKGRLIIEPFSSVIITTEETIKLPSNIIGRFGLRIKFAIEGLILQVGPQIEPYTYTKLMGMLTNFSGNPIVINQGEEIFTAEFEYIKSVDGIVKEKPDDINDFIRNYCDANNFISLGKQLSKYSIDNANLHNKILTNFSWTMPLIIAIIIPIITLIITKFTYDVGSFPASLVIEKERELDSLKKEIQNLKLEIRGTKENNENTTIDRIKK